MKKLATLVTLNRNYKTALSLDDFGNKSVFKDYKKSVDSLGESMLKWAQSDRNDCTTQDIIDTVFTDVRRCLAFFSDSDFKVKADQKSVRALRDTAIKMRLVYSDDYKTASKQKQTSRTSINIYLNDLVKLNIVVPMFTKIHDLDPWIKTLDNSKISKVKETSEMLKKAIASYDSACAEVTRLEKGEYCWYEPTLDSKFRNHFEDFVSDRINDRLMHEVENREAKKKARAEKQRAKRAESKKASK